MDLFDAYLRRSIWTAMAGSVATKSSLSSKALQLMPSLGAQHMAPPAGRRLPKIVAHSHIEEKQQAN
ncbi:hypothetical protein DVH24_014506 [Malus domestica]|uniref:Uncharacterized protein n=1 Tax=Malus domestica TaxID=3750 RepID=A0A498KI22_MALDO|nr:hypothetical protein DVH24_014506 [Malus domestica]